MAALNFLIKLRQLCSVFVILRDDNIYIGKNVISVMGKIGFEYGFIGILSNRYFVNGKKMRIMP